LAFPASYLARFEISCPFSHDPILAFGIGAKIADVFRYAASVAMLSVKKNETEACPQRSGRFEKRRGLPPWW
jgi:hypothetical protein